MSGERDRAGKSKRFAEADAFEERGARARWRCEQYQAGEGDYGPDEARPTCRRKAGRLDSRDQAEQGNDDHDQPGDEGGFRWRGEFQTGGLELISETEED